MGQFNTKVKMDVVADLLKAGNGQFTVAELSARLGNSERRVRSAIFWARKLGTQLYTIRTSVAGARGAGEVVSYSTTAPAPVAVTPNVAKVKAPKAAKPAKVKAPKVKAAKPAPQVAVQAAETVATVEAAAKPAPKTMSIEQVRAALAARKPKVA